MNQRSIEEILRSHQPYHNVVPFDASANKIIKPDFTSSNKELTLEILNNTEAFTVYMNSLLQSAGATYGVGGYNEHRTIYQRSHVFDSSFSELNVVGENTTTSEPRRLHLGIDIWGDALTPVYAPLRGIVHSFSFNDAFGDYGATLILQHELDGVIFHTLYGHLSLSSIQEKQEGQTVEAGEWIAAFGEPAENGNWPPHLHFQVIIDMLKSKGDYPGVCKFSEREKFLANSPDPDLILGMMQYASDQSIP